MALTGVVVLFDRTTCTASYSTLYAAYCSKVKCMPPKATTSSYAVLALLALKPWTGYDLTHQAQRSIRFAWSKSERLFYAEPKKLVELGFATVHQEDSGKRTRNVYTITEEGCQALSEGHGPEPGHLDSRSKLY